MVKFWCQKHKCYIDKKKLGFCLRQNRKKGCVNLYAEGRRNEILNSGINHGWRVGLVH